VLINFDGSCKLNAASNLPRRGVMVGYLLFCRAGAQLVMSSCRWSLVKKTLQFRAITLHWVKVTVRSAATCCSVRPYPRLNQSHALPDMRSNLCTQDVLQHKVSYRVRQLLMAGLISNQDSASLLFAEAIAFNIIYYMRRNIL